MSRRSIHPLAEAPLKALLQQNASGDATFTQCGLRDGLYAHPDLTAFGPKTLRYYVRGQMALYEKRGWVERVGTLGKRRALYRVTPAYAEQLSETAADPDGQGERGAGSLDAQLQRDSEALRTEITASESRLQAFREIAAKYPGARDEITPLFEQEKARAKALGEKLTAYAEVRQRLAQAGGEV